MHDKDVNLVNGVVTDSILSSFTIAIFTIVECIQTKNLF